MDKHPPEPLVAHELPPAPSFFGRDRELEELRRAWAGGFCGVLALVGLGGAGKTALAARFLEELCRQPGPLPPCDGLLAWSFYRNQDAGGLLQEACAYFCQGPAAGAARGLRILRMFQECPSRWALAWFLRALGELDEAYRQHTLPYFRADIRLLEGRLPLVAAEDDHHRSSLAAFLMGASQRVPDVELGCAIPLGQLYLYLGQLEAARRVSQVKDLYGEFGWEGDPQEAQ